MTSSLQNPWYQLPLQPDYVLPEDVSAVRRFNESARESVRLQLELMPEPYLGRPDAPVVLLNKNPGFTPEGPRAHRDQAFLERSRCNLEHCPSAYPFYLLDPALNTKGTEWWHRILGRLIENLGLEIVARNILCVEYLPYHSSRFPGRFRHGKLSLPSQQYSFSLVRAAVRRGAVIMVLRGERRWLTAVQELESYPRRFMVSNVQNPVISPANCADGYERVLDALAGSSEAVGV
jgi:hypothetical protein